MKWKENLERIPDAGGHSQGCSKRVREAIGRNPNRVTSIFGNVAIELFQLGNANDLNFVSLGVEAGTGRRVFAV